jgi:hypothetical protein
MIFQQMGNEHSQPLRNEGRLGLLWALQPPPNPAEPAI